MLDRLGFLPLEKVDSILGFGFYRIERKFVVSEVANEVSEIKIRTLSKFSPPVLYKVSLLN